MVGESFPDWIWVIFHLLLFVTLGTTIFSVVKRNYMECPL